MFGEGLYYREQLDAIKIKTNTCCYYAANVDLVSPIILFQPRGKICLITRTGRWRRGELGTFETEGRREWEKEGGKEDGAR